MRQTSVMLAVGLLLAVPVACANSGGSSSGSSSSSGGSGAMSSGSSGGASSGSSGGASSGSSGGASSGSSGGASSGSSGGGASSSGGSGASSSSSGTPAAADYLVIAGSPSFPAYDSGPLDDVFLISQPLDDAGDPLGPAVQLSPQPVGGFFDSSALQVRLHPDGRRLFYGSTSSELSIVPLDGSSPPASLGTSIYYYDVSPDGTYVVTSTGAMALRTGDYTSPRNVGSIAGIPHRALRWAADGSSFAFTYSDLNDSTTHAATVVTATRVATDLTGLASPQCVAINGAGTRVAFIRDGSAVVADIDGSNETVLGAADVLRGSPDGSRFMYATDGSLSTSLFDGTGVVVVDTGGSYYWLPYVGAFSPNGSAIQYYRDGALFIATPQTSGSGTDLGSGAALRWSPTGVFGMRGVDDTLITVLPSGTTEVAYQGITPDLVEIGNPPSGEYVVDAKFIAPDQVLLSGQDSSGRATAAVVTVNGPTPPPAPLAAMDIPSAIEEIRPVAMGNEEWKLVYKDCYRGALVDLICIVVFRQDLPGTSAPNDRPDQSFVLAAAANGEIRSSPTPPWRVSGDRGLNNQVATFFSKPRP